MEIVFGVVFPGDLGKQKIAFLQVVLVNLAAFRYQAGLLEDHIPAFGLQRGEPRFGGLVTVVAGSRAAELQGGAVAFFKE